MSEDGKIADVSENVSDAGQSGTLAVQNGNLADAGQSGDFAGQNVMEVKQSVKVDQPVTQQPANVEDEPEQFRKIFIGGLLPTTTAENLRAFYCNFGTLVDCIVIQDGITKKSRGFGFVTYASKGEVDTAMNNRPHVIDGKTVDAKRSVPRDQTTPGKPSISTQRLFVSGIQESHTEDHFKNYFNEFGNVTKVEIVTDKATNKPRGFGFITFDDYDSVDKCVLAKSHMINGIRCDVKKGLSRDEMIRSQQHSRDRMDRGYRSRGGGMPVRGRGNGFYGYGISRGGAVGDFREPHGYSAAQNAYPATPNIGPGAVADPNWYWQGNYFM